MGCTMKKPSPAGPPHYPPVLDLAQRLGSQRAIWKGQQAGFRAKGLWTFWEGKTLQETMVPWCTMTFFHLQEQMYLCRCGGYCSSWIVWVGVKMKGRLMSLDQQPQVVFFLIVVHKGGISVINVCNYIKDLTHTHEENTKIQPSAPYHPKIPCSAWVSCLDQYKLLGVMGWILNGLSQPNYLILDRGCTPSVYPPALIHRPP